MSSHKMFLVVAVLGSTCWASAVLAQEKKLQMKDLPVAVAKTVAEQSKGAAVKGFSSEVEDGNTRYEAELTVHGHGKSISMDPKGNVVEVEEEIAISAIPQAVKDGLMKSAGKGTLEKVETLTKQGKLVAYEAAVKTGSKTSEIQVGPDGKKLAHPE